MALNSKIVAQVVAQLTGTGDLVTPVASLTQTKRVALASGVGANQADKVWSDQRPIAASGTDSLDLAGVLTDVFGAAFTLARIKGLYVAAAAANVNNVNVTRPAANGVPLFLAAGDGIPVRPGGAFLWVAPDATGVAVTAGTGDLLDIVNSGAGTGVTYDIVIIGASA
jgi:hypothetical protein